MKIVIAGATGWVGRALVSAVAASNDLTLVAAVARSAAGQDVGEAIGGKPLGIKIVATMEEALTVPSDVVIDYTSAKAIKQHAQLVIAAHRNLVIGSSGLGHDDLEEIAVLARRQGVGVIAAGNFSITATLLKRFALEAARYVADVEVIEYARAEKADPPTGTGREITEALSLVRQQPTSVPADALTGLTASRGASVQTGEHPVRLHSVYMPSYVLAVETIHAAKGERLVLRHEAGTSADPYVAGTLFAAREVTKIKGLVRGLDSLIQ